MRYFIRKNASGFYILDSATGKAVCSDIDTMARAQSVLANLADGKQGTFDSIPEAKESTLVMSFGGVKVGSVKLPF